MPILWRYLVSYFLKIVLACVLAFVAILLTMRLDEIAHFAALGAPFHYLVYFTLYQVPYILPIALPLSCLIGSLILIQRLSLNHELTALRACGFSFFNILTPILLTAVFLSVGNFWIGSELATQSHLRTNLLKSELRSINPLFLLHNKHLMRLKGYYFDALGPSHVGESAENAILALPNKHQQRLSLMVAKELKASPTLFTANGVTLITGTMSKENQDFDDLLIENMKHSETQIEDFSSLLQRKVWTINNDYLRMPLLIERIKEQKEIYQKGKLEGENRDQLKSLRHHLNRSFSEIIKRFSIALAVFSFTLMGASFGITISRKKSYFNLYLAISLTVFYLIAFFVAKGMDHSIWATSVLYITPHLIIVFASMMILKQMTKGIE